MENPAEEKAGLETIAALNGGLRDATDAETSHGSNGSGEEQDRTESKESESSVNVE